MSDPTRAAAHAFMYFCRFDSNLRYEHKNLDHRFRPTHDHSRPGSLYCYQEIFADRATFSSSTCKYCDRIWRHRIRGGYRTLFPFCAQGSCIRCPGTDDWLSAPARLGPFSGPAGDRSAMGHCDPVRASISADLLALAGLACVLVACLYERNHSGEYNAVDKNRSFTRFYHGRL
jgi:hypothetical protein